MLRPEDLDVKIDGQELCVTANQDLDSAPGHGHSRSRVFEQKFTLPLGIKPSDVQSSLTRTGKLIITAPSSKIETIKSEERSFLEWNKFIINLT